MKCVNCTSDALYEYKVTQKTSIFYCEKDLPKFLISRRNAGMLAITPEYTEGLESAIATLSDPAPEAPKKVVKKQAK